MSAVKAACLLQMRSKPVLFLHFQSQAPVSQLVYNLAAAMPEAKVAFHTPHIVSISDLVMGLLH